MKKTYSIAVGKGNDTEALDLINKKTLDEVFEELQTLAENYKRGYWMAPAVTGDGSNVYSQVEWDKKLLDGLKNDTVHLAFGQKSRVFFWVNINALEVP